VIRAILFYAAVLLIIALFSEEFARALERFRDRLKRDPRYRRLVYPLLLVLLIAAGIVIVAALIDFSTSGPFSYE